MRIQSVPRPAGCGAAAGHGQRRDARRSSGPPSEDRSSIRARPRCPAPPSLSATRTPTKWRPPRRTTKATTPSRSSGPALYTLTVEMSGFQKYTRTDMRLQVGQIADDQRAARRRRLTEKVTVSASRRCSKPATPTAARSSTARASPSCRCSRAARWRSPCSSPASTTTRRRSTSVRSTTARSPTGR